MGVPPPLPGAIKVEEQGKRGRWKAIKVWEYRQNKKHGIYTVNGGKEYKASRPGGLERVCGGEKVIIRARERKEEKPICSSRLSRSCFTLSRAYESCFACRTLISNWIDRCLGQHLRNSVHSLSTDNPRIPTNPLSGSQQPPATVRAMNKNQILLEMNAAIAVMLDSNWNYFSAPSYMKGFLLTV